MRGYQREELEDYDEYEEEGDEYEEEDGEEVYEEEEERKPTKEELDYLELRQRLKESIRKQLKKDNSSSHPNSQEKKKKLPYDNYGSFFGPSQPVIAQRVIQESKSLLETRHLASRDSNSHHGNKKKSTSTGSNPGMQRQMPKVTNQLKTKVQKLKDTRDYSFLLSDDAEPPAPTKVPPVRNVSVPKSEARPAEVPMKSKQPLNNSGRHANSFGEERKPVSMNGQMHSRMGFNKLASASKPNLTSASKPNLTSGGKPSLSSGGKPSLSSGGKTNVSSAGKPNLTSVDRKQLGSKPGSGPGRPLGPKGLPLKNPIAKVEKRASAPSANNSMSGGHKPLYSKLQSSNPHQHLENRKGKQEPSKGKMITKPPESSSKPQYNKPLKQNPSRPTSSDHRPKKRPVRQYSDDEDDDEGGKAISMIRNMFRYNPKRYADIDDDLSDMEANFDDIMKEEQRSSRIARKEDEEQLRLIEEEEERERLARMKRLEKKRKLG